MIDDCATPKPYFGSHIGFIETALLKLHMTTDKALNGSPSKHKDKYRGVRVKLTIPRNGWVGALAVQTPTGR